jgi:hypothetical protein
MSVILDAQFATVEDTAEALGVSEARVKRLLRLAGPKARAERALTTLRYKKANGRWKSNVASSTRRKRTRGKTKKAAH